MDNTYAILHLLRGDISLLGELLVVVGILMIVPAILLGFIAAARTEPTLWRDLPVGVLCSWFAGSGLATLLVLVGQGVYVLAEQAIPRNYRPTLGGLALISSVVGFVACLVVQYRAAARYYRWEIEKRLGWRIDQPSPQPANRWYSFSLRNLLLVQLAVVAAFGLWVSARRDRINFRYERIKYAAWQAEVQERLDAHGWDLRLVHRPLRLASSDRQLYDFSDEVLDVIYLTDQLEELELISDHLTDEGIKKIVVHERLQTLKLCSHKITDAGIAQLTQLPNLKWLMITAPQLTDTALDDLQTMASLRTIIIKEAAISAEAEARFKAARPEVTLIVLSRRPRVLLPLASGQTP